MELEHINFKHQTPIQIRFNDVDGMGHVNNAVHQYYFDYGRMKYFETANEGDIKWQDLGIVIASLKVDFVAPIFLNDKIQVKTKVYHLGNKSLKMIQIIEDTENRTIKSVCKSVMVGFDIKTNTSQRIPENWREKFRMMEPDILEKEISK